MHVRVSVILQDTDQRSVVFYHSTEFRDKGCVKIYLIPKTMAAPEPEKKYHLFSYLSNIMLIKTILVFWNKQNWCPENNLYSLTWLTISFILSWRIYLILVIVHRARSTQLPIRSQEADRRCPLHGVICSAGLSGNKTESHTIVGNVFSPCRLENTKAVIKNGQSRETVNIGYTRPIIRKWIAAPSLHIFLIAVKRRDLGGTCMRCYLQCL